jgi:hypothetical protein
MPGVGQKPIPTATVQHSDSGDYTTADGGFGTGTSTQTDDVNLGRSQVTTSTIGHVDVSNHTISVMA